jgi:membrane fusion protein, multidrug efflux system
MKLRCFYCMAVCITVVVSGCSSSRKTSQGEDAVPVRVMRVALSDIVDAVEYIGNIKAQDEAQVFPKVGGKIIEKRKNDGERVDKGDVIALIDRDEVGMKYEPAPIESPLSGVIGRVFIDRGMQVTTQTPIALVVDMDKVLVTVDIPEKYISKISIGQKTIITVDAYSDQSFPGSVTKVSPVVDVSNRAVPIEITVDNPRHQLQSGMFARAALVFEQKKAVPVILKEALMGRDHAVSVYVIENKKAQMRAVTTGIRQGALYEVIAGLREGDQVVIMGQQRLYEGAPVTVEE